MTELSVTSEDITAENPVLVAAARQHYDDDLLDYHGFDFHIMTDVWPTARRLAIIAMSDGHEIDIPALDAMCVYHDAEEHRPLSKRFKTRERRAASIARHELPTLELGYTTDQITLISEGIITTTAGMRPKSKEGAILKRADGFNAGLSVPEFLSRSARILREQRKLERIGMEPADLERWKDIACKILNSNLDCDPGIEDFAVPDLDTTGIAFIDRGLGNIATLAAQSVDTIAGWLHKHGA